MPKPAPADAWGKTLTDAQLAAWASSSGFPADQQAVAVAVALAESDGKYAEVGSPNPDGSRDYGAWQINDRAHADLFAKWPDWWTASNGQMAYAVWADRRARTGNGWEAWSTYNNNAYRLYTGRGRAAVAAGGGNTRGADGSAVAGPEFDPTLGVGPALAGVGQSVLDVGNAVRGVSQGVFKAGVWMADAGNWARVAQVAVGGALIYAAVQMLIIPQTQKIAKTVAGVTPAGAAKTVAAKAATGGGR